LLMESFSTRPVDNATIIADAFFYALLCPPIAVMIVDKMHSFNL